MKILIAGASVRWMAESAKRAGLNFVAADLFADQDTRRAGRVHQMLRFHQIAEVVRRESPTHLIFGGGFENHPELLDALPANINLLSAEPRQLIRCNDWRQLAELFGDQFPQCKPELEENDCPTDWIIKNPGSAGGRGIQPATTNPAAKAVPGRYFQQRINGTSFGANFLTDGNQTKLLGTFRQLPSPGSGARQFWYTGSLGPICLSRAISTCLQITGQTVAQKFQLKGLFGIDFILTSDRQLYFLEINPRPTASAELLDLAIVNPHGSLVSAHVRACLGRLQEFEVAALPIQGKRIVYWCPSKNERRSIYPTSSLTDHWLTIDPNQTGWRLADIPVAETEILPDQPVATILASANDVHTVESRLDQAHFEIMRQLESSIE